MLKNVIWKCFEAVKFWWFSKSIYQIHSHTLFSLLESLLTDRRTFYVYGDIIPLHERNKRNKNYINWVDFGAGSMQIKQSKKIRIQDLYAKSVSPIWKCQMLSRIVRYYEPKKVLEIGTNLGISSAYLASTLRSVNFIGLEGCPDLVSITKNNLKNIGLSNYKIVEGNFNTTLPIALQENEDLDMVFMDGNHTYDATINYFNQISKSQKNPCLIIVDDIYWSKGMLKAWKELVENDNVSYSINLYFIGLICINSKSQIDPKHYDVSPLRYFLP